MTEKKSHPVLKAIGIILLILLVVIGVFAALVYNSAMKLKTDGQDILDDVEVIIDQVSNGDTSDFPDDVADIASRIDDIDAEIDGTLWSIVAHFPVIGEDVAIAQTLVDVADDMVDNAIIPVLDDVYYLDVYTIVTDILNGKYTLEDLREFMELLENSIEVINRSDETIDALPEPNFASLQEIVDQIKEIMDEITSVADTVDAVLELADDLVGSFM